MGVKVGSFFHKMSAIHHSTFSLCIQNRSCWPCAIYEATLHLKQNCYLQDSKFSAIFFGWFAHNFGLFWEDNFLHLIFWHQWQNVKGNLTSPNQQQSIAITQVMKLLVVDKMTVIDIWLLFLKVPLSFVHTLAQEPQRRPYPVQHRQYCTLLGKTLTFCLIFITLGWLFTPKEDSTAPHSTGIINVISTSGNLSRKTF